jgi:4-diphosphocytidyl-2-C-methyl-D-erythritol kinase
VIGKRPDGFHEIETAFIPVKWKDALEVIPSNEETSLTNTGITIEGDPEKNLVLKAYHLLNDKFNLPKVQFHLHKSIPSGAGLGGGSSDAAFCLKLLNDKFNLNLKKEELLDYSAQLGSDCPFFILNETCIATGRGEILQKIEIPDLNSLFIAIVFPGIHINTAWAFSQIAPSGKKGLREKLSLSVNYWKDSIINDFERPVFGKFPEIAEIKNMLYEKGAIYASLSGSGSSVYGFFATLSDISFPKNYLVKICPPAAG